MPYLCPECLTPDSLEIAYSLAFPPDSRSDEVFLQVVGCGRCGLSALAVYEESRRGRLDQEAYNHTGYRASEGLVDMLGTLIRACPEPGNPRCQCETHRRLGRTDAQGSWEGVEELPTLEQFRMVMS